MSKQPQSGARDEIIVVGAGLVGSLLAIYLAHRGHRVKVLERHADLRQVELGTSRSSINLSLCARGFRALERVGIDQAVGAHSVASYGRLIHHRDGMLVFQPYGDNGEATYSILRNQLNCVLVDYAESRFGVEFQFHSRCLDVDLQRACVRVEDTRGGGIREVAGRVVFGADGVFSKVRSRLQRTDGFNYSQQYLGHGYLELNIPAVHGRRWADHRPAVHLWPRGGYMLLGLPNLDGSLVCSIHLPVEGDPSFAALASREKLLGFLSESFPDIADLMPEAVEQLSRHATNRLVSIRCFPWTHGGRVALIGDAAHAVFPFLAQGVNAGFEDCLVLDDCLEEHGDDWDAALRAYERRRKPDADAVSDLSLRHFAELRDQVGKPEFQLRKRIERRLAQLFPERFVPLYSIVTFSSVPYSEALQRGQEQEELLQRILARRLDCGGTEADLDRLIQETVDPSWWTAGAEVA